MRLFVAVELPPAVAAAAVAVGSAARERVTRLAPRARLTWVAPDRMHLTVRFIGDVDEPRARRIAAALAGPLQTPAFGLSLGQAGIFPSRGKPRVIWVGVEYGRQDLLQLEQEVSARLEPAGVPPDAGPFSPHLTLARVRDPGALHSAALDGVKALPDAGSVVDAITLFESRLSPEGPTYIALQRTPLHGV